MCIRDRSVYLAKHCPIVCKSNRKKEEGSKIDLHFFPMQFFLQKRWKLELKVQRHPSSIWIWFINRHDWQYIKIVLISKSELNKLLNPKKGGLFRQLRRRGGLMCPQRNNGRWCSQFSSYINNQHSIWKLWCLAFIWYPGEVSEVISLASAASRSDRWQR